jgi:hypothetical protein
LSAQFAGLEVIDGVIRRTQRTVIEVTNLIQLV